jgi:type III pantothenate kinase
MNDDFAHPMAQACLLIIEVGNSHVSVASAIDGVVRAESRFTHGEIWQAVDYAGEVWDALPDDRARAIAAASVVPAVFQDLQGRMQERLTQEVLVVGRDLHRPMSIALEAPELVGIDRICAAAAAYETARRACAVASFGTAITIDCVNDEGAFLGGAILPGFYLQAHALAEGTAALPEVSVEETGHVYGVDTQEAIRNGVLYGAAGALREITERYATDLGAWPLLIVTGGGAELMRRHCDFIDHVVPDLVLRGIALAYRRHFAPLEE